MMPTKGERAEAVGAAADHPDDGDIAIPRRRDRVHRLEGDSVVFVHLFLRGGSGDVLVGFVCTFCVRINACLCFLWKGVDRAAG